MEDLSLVYVKGDVTLVVNIINIILLALFTYYTDFKISNKKIEFSMKNIIGFIIIIVVSAILGLIKYKVHQSIILVCIVLIISFILSTENIASNILMTIISLSVNYVIFLVTIIIGFIINKLMQINNDYINLIIIKVMHLILLYRALKVKRLKYGFSFFRRKKQNDYVDILILNIFAIIIFSITILLNANLDFARDFGISLILFAIIMIIILQKSFQVYYKQRLLIKDLEETKAELDRKNKEIIKLEKENLEISKKSHSLVHKQNALEFKINELLKNNDSSQINLAKEQLGNIFKELYGEKEAVSLAKTGIDLIDNMLEYMQSECRKNKIDFELQICGNIHYMVNNLIEEESLEILLADHIKNAIIAINHSDNINKSILVRIGKINNIYSIYIYDSGIEFEEETLNNLGKKPSSTYLCEGGSGMGFMNTFNTLKKCKASLIINEKGRPSKEDYTKAIIIKFDQKNEIKIISYRELLFTASNDYSLQRVKVFIKLLTSSH